MTSTDNIKVACSNCNLRTLCMPVGLEPAELQRIDDIVAKRRKVRRREALFRAGEIIGLDGIVNDRHTCDAVALEDAEVCVMPFERIEALSREVSALQRHVHQIMSREIVREHGVMLLLGSMRAEERLAAFLLNLVRRLHARGFSESELVLRMTREEIGSYLGLKLETVSRTLSKFMDDGILQVRQRHLRIVDADALQRVFNRAGD